MYDTSYEYFFEGGRGKLPCARQLIKPASPALPCAFIYELIYSGLYNPHRTCIDYV